MFRKRNGKNRHNMLYLFKKMEDPVFYVLDTETTGLDPASDRIAELAVIRCSAGGGRLAREEARDWFIRPDVPMGAKAREVNGLDEAALEGMPAEGELFGEISSFLGDRPVIAGHNIGFDLGFLRAMYARHGEALACAAVLDTAEMARDLIDPEILKAYLKERDGEGADLARPYRLGVLAGFYGVDAGLRAHSAMDDAEMACRLLPVLYAEYARAEEPGRLKRLRFKYCYFWEGHNREQQGVWVRLEDDRMIYYSTLYKAWMSSKVDLSEYDVDRLEDEILGLCGITLPELGRMTRKKWEELKRKRRAEGVRI